jgi:hypothetical protein
MIGVPVSPLLEYCCCPMVHRIVVLLRDGSGAGELHAGNAGCSGCMLCHPLSYGRTAYVSQADEDDPQAGIS